MMNTTTIILQLAQVYQDTNILNPYRSGEGQKLSPPPDQKGPNRSELRNIILSLFNKRIFPAIKDG